MTENKRILCANVEVDSLPMFEDALWETAVGETFVDVVTGKQPFLSTGLKALRSDAAKMLFFRFDLSDDHVFSPYRMHDETLYRADVCELFLCDTGDLNRYIELEVSPYGVTFDGMITYDVEGNRHLDMSWEAPDFAVKVRQDGLTATQLWALPYAVFDNPPRSGESWRFGAFRIDHHPERGETLHALCQTGKPSFHVPSCFAALVFQ